MGHGHSPGDLVAYLSERRVLFAGDLVFAGQHGRLKTANVDGLLDILERQVLPAGDTRNFPPPDGRGRDRVGWHAGGGNANRAFGII